MSSEIAWLAGIVEGEGCFTTEGRCAVWMKDQDIIERCREVSGLGRLFQRDANQLFGWHVMRRAEMRLLVPMLYPWLGQRRRAQVDRMIEAVDLWTIRKGERHAAYDPRARIATSGVHV